MSTLTRLIRYVLYTNRFWYVVFVPVLALVCAAVTEWVRLQGK